MAASFYGFISGVTALMPDQSGDQLQQISAGFFCGFFFVGACHGQAYRYRYRYDQAGTKAPDHQTMSGEKK
jgi:hypothetical protein